MYEEIMNQLCDYSYETAMEDLRNDWEDVPEWGEPLEWEEEEF
jgi:hypothetical protein